MLMRIIIERVSGVKNVQLLIKLIGLLLTTVAS